LIGSGSLATVRGCLLSADDRVRGYVIERLMCDFSFSRDRLLERFGAAALPVIEDADAIVGADRDGFVEATADGFRVTPLGRPFVRTVAACFDAYLEDNQTTKFSVAV